MWAVVLSHDLISFSEIGLYCSCTVIAVFMLLQLLHLIRIDLVICVKYFSPNMMLTLIYLQSPCLSLISYLVTFIRMYLTYLKQLSSKQIFLMSVIFCRILHEIRRLTSHNYHLSVMINPVIITLLLHIIFIHQMRRAQIWIDLFSTSSLLGM